MSHFSATRAGVTGAIVISAAVAAIGWVAMSGSEKPVDRAVAVRPQVQDPETDFARYEAFYRMTQLAREEVAAGRLERAELLATKLLEIAPQFKHDWNYGNAIHHGHTVHGLIAIARGDVERAKRELLLSAETPGSPQLDSFGPTMVLAEALIQRGERSVVLDYMNRCRRFWEMGSDDLDEWESDLRNNRTPRLNPNTAY